MNLRPSKIPVQLRHLIGLAEKYGLPNDKIRRNVVVNFSLEERRSTKEAVEEYDDKDRVRIDVDGPGYLEADTWYGAPFDEDIRNIKPGIEENLDEVARLLNERPRKTLNYETPAQRFHQCIASTD